MPHKIICREIFSKTTAFGRGIVVLHLNVKSKIMETLTALYVVPTPLGNLADISERAVSVLCSVNVIAAEDTRHTALLLKHCGCKTPMLSLHEHNEGRVAQKIIARLHLGESVALVSDAGTPTISDPGARLVARVLEEGFRIIPLPGPCAAITALSASGLTESRFLFYGFLPSKAKAREEVLRKLIALPYVLIFYEAPHRIISTVKAIQLVFGEERTLVVARELTKIFETIHKGSIKDVLAWLLGDVNQQRGEFVLLLEGVEQKMEGGTADKLLKMLLDEGLPVKQVARIASALTGDSKNILYKKALQILQMNVR